jgi:membrane protein required for colicin V production
MGNEQPKGTNLCAIFAKTPGMTFLDIFLGLLLLWGVYRGLKNGLLIEVASIIALIAGLFGAFHFSYIVADYLSETWHWNITYINLIAFIITFFLIVIAVNLLARLLTKVINIAMLGLLNKIAGAFFGALKVAVILGAFLVFFDRVNTSFEFLSEKTKNESALYGPIRDIGALVFGKVFRAVDTKNDDSEPSYTL